MEVEMEEKVGKVSFNSRGLLTVLHPAVGNVEQGKEMCDKIRRRLAGSSMSFCIFHDATSMQTANRQYATAFKELDKEISERVVEIVCAVPGPIPRMMAQTVAMFSQKKWKIFKERTEAEQYVKSKGYLKENEKLFND